MVVVVVVVEVVVVLVDVVVVGGAVVVVVGGTVVVGARVVGVVTGSVGGGTAAAVVAVVGRVVDVVVVVVPSSPSSSSSLISRKAPSASRARMATTRPTMTAVRFVSRPLVTAGQVGSAFALFLARDRRGAEHGGGACGWGVGADRVDELGGRLERVDGLARLWTRCAGHGERVADRPGGVGVPGRIAGSGRRGEGIVRGRGHRLRGVGIGRRFGAGARRRAGLALGSGAIGRGALGGLVVARGAVGAVVTGRVGSHGRQPRTRGRTRGSATATVRPRGS